MSITISGNGPPSAGSAPFSYDCPPGTYITGINGRAGGWQDAIGVTCGTSAKPLQSRSPMFGGVGGTNYKDSSSIGYIGVLRNVVDKYVTSYQPRRATGSAMTYGPPIPTTVPKNMDACPSGQKYISISGSAGEYVDSLAFTCGMPAAAPVASQPTVSATAPDTSFNQPLADTSSQSDMTGTWLLVLFFIFIIAVAIMYYTTSPKPPTNPGMFVQPFVPPMNP